MSGYESNSLLRTMIARLPGMPKERSLISAWLEGLIYLSPPPLDWLWRLSTLKSNLYTWPILLGWNSWHFTLIHHVHIVPNVPYLPHKDSYLNLIIVQKDSTYTVYYISVGSSTCFGCWHPLSEARTTVITASGIDSPHLLPSALVVELELNHVYRTAGI
jgi:hypothetical protein